MPACSAVSIASEVGADTGDFPGEFQYWVERLPLPQTLPFPQGYRSLRYNPALGVLGRGVGPPFS